MITSQTLLFTPDILEQDLRPNNAGLDSVRIRYDATDSATNESKGFYRHHLEFQGPAAVGAEGVLRALGNDGSVYQLVANLSLRTPTGGAANQRYQGHIIPVSAPYIMGAAPPADADYSPIVDQLGNVYAFGNVYVRGTNPNLTDMLSGVSAPLLIPTGHAIGFIVQQTGGEVNADDVLLTGGSISVIKHY